jgi:predicted phosphodiesterase
MKIALLSDLHAEFRSQTVPHLTQDVDVLVLAGDIDSASKAIARSLGIANGRAQHIVQVAGNHEFYGTRLDKGYTRLAADAEASNRLYQGQPQVHFLQNSSVEINGTTFVGATLWTDYELDGRGPLDMLQAEGYMNDHRRIKFKASGEVYRRFLPRDAQLEHFNSRAFLASELGKLRRVFVTHHAPSRMSVHEKYRMNTMNSAYASNLDWMMEDGPDYWFHGHMHDPANYVCGKTRVMANPHGYPSERVNPQIVYMEI